MPRQSPRKNYTVLSHGLLFSYILLLLVPPLASSRRLPILAMTRHSPDGSPPSHPALLLPRISPPLGISPHCRLILASQSPRRREILDMMGLAGSYEVIVSSFDESTLFELKRTADPTDYVKHSACQKAADVCSRLSSPEDGCPVVVIGSDTVVDLDGDILEKPRDEAEATDMLKRMSGRTHLVHTGVALYSSSNGYSGPSSNFSVSTKVTFAELSDADVSAYVATGEPMDKAGAYGIQGVGGQMVRHIDGDFFAVMGFPMHQFGVELTKLLDRVAAGVE